MSTLYLIPVPIADDALQTIPPYVRAIVEQLDFFIAERAKTARHFLKASGTSRPLQEITVVEIDERDPQYAREAFLQTIKSGRDIGLLSEAGCPGVADPGADIVALAHERGVPVRPLVGPSSLLLALMASGMNGQSFVFHGYLPPKRPELARALRQLEQQASRQKQTQIFIETPYRSQMVLEVALEALQPQTRFGVAQDITGAQEWICSLPVRDWPKAGKKVLEKLPAVFLIG
ncbi:MAG: SAM-dependent methyltransferase [Lewinellaceae bacterium]|nr:SAM-dependent methyltransferase [Lewinellaceae bacterium]